MTVRVALVPMAPTPRAWRVAGGTAASPRERARTDGRDETEPLEGPRGARGRMSERHSMRKIREVLRLKFEVGLSHRQVAAAVGISRGSVSDYLERAKEAELMWEIARGLSDAEVEARLFQQLGRNEPSTRAPVDLGWVHREMRPAGATLQLLWSEYQAATAERADGARPYQYSQFCDLYRAYRAKLQPSMRQVHRAGEKGFIDFSGKKPRIHDPKSGEALEVELYVMVLGASNYTYATATRTQSLDDFVEATARGLEYFGCVPDLLVPDQLRSAVKKPDWSEPEINETFAEMAQHYGAAIVPARPGKPKERRRWRWGCRWRSAGSSRACATGASSASRNSTRRSPSCARS